MHTQPDDQSGAIALKEWAVTCRALQQGRQIVLLRKGGLLDANGIFALEHPAFWLQPTYEHQHLNLVKPPHRDLFGEVEAERLEGENQQFIALKLFARVEKVFAFKPADVEQDKDKLRGARHIWSEVYLKLRYHYKPDHPLLCVALRVYQAPQPHCLPMRPQFSGCRSWIDLPASLDAQDLRPALDDATFARYLAELEAIFGAVAVGAAR